MAIPRYDVLKRDCGGLRWIEAVDDLESARLRIQELGNCLNDFIAALRAALHCCHGQAVVPYGSVPTNALVVSTPTLRPVDLGAPLLPPRFSVSYEKSEA
jgi:hypothetical protein